MRWVYAFFLGVLLLWPQVVSAEVLRTEEKELYAAYFFVENRPPTTLGYIFTNFGPGNINFLERVDIVLDNEGRLAGVLLVYTPADGFRRHVFLADCSGWMFEEKREGSIGKKVIIRVVTTHELNRLR